MILLVRNIASREDVVMGCERAMAHGVREGMSVAHARALLGGCDVRKWEHDPQADRTALERLAVWATRFAPLVAADPDDEHSSQMSAVRAMPGLLADISGCERMYDGEINLLKQMHAAVCSLGFRARIASAPTFGCAWAAARFGEDVVRVISHEEIHSVLDDLPLRGLRMDADVEHACSQIGVTTIGQLLDLPRSSLPARFGSDVLLRIDQALGHAIEVINPVRSAMPMRVCRLFNGPVTQLQAIELTVQQLLHELCEQLLHHEAGTRQLHVTLERSDCDPYCIEISASRFSRDAAHWWVLLRPHMEQAHLGYGVDSITLTARHTGRITHDQHVHHAIAHDAHATGMQGELARAIDTLSNRLGNEHVVRAALIESHLPELAVRFTQAMKQPQRTARTGRQTAQLHHRPVALLPRPQPIDVTAMSPDGPLLQIQWRRELLRITHSVGPERITGPWWKMPRITGAGRDYFRAQDEHGRWWWLFRQTGTQRWFMHGGWV